MKITSATFIKSSKSFSKGPEDPFPEFAFIGRSNVGKSSLINMLVSVKGLAKTSATPGKTQLINHFLINDNWYLVDLPGIGYARIAQSERKSWMPMISEYLTRRPTLVHTFMLVDARLSPQKIDLEFMNDLVKKQVPFSIIFTKTDKLKRMELQQNMRAYKKTLLGIWEYLPAVFLTSSTDKSGRDEVLGFIEALLEERSESCEF